MKIIQDIYIEKHTTIVDLSKLKWWLYCDYEKGICIYLQFSLYWIQVTLCNNCVSKKKKVVVFGD